MNCQFDKFYHSLWKTKLLFLWQLKKCDYLALWAGITSFNQLFLKDVAVSLSTIAIDVWNACPNMTFEFRLSSLFLPLYQAKSWLASCELRGNPYYTDTSSLIAFHRTAHLYSEHIDLLMGIQRGYSTQRPQTLELGGNFSEQAVNGDLLEHSFWDEQTSHSLAGNLV